MAERYLDAASFAGARTGSRTPAVAVFPRGPAAGAAGVVVFPRSPAAVGVVKSRLCLLGALVAGEFHEVASKFAILKQVRAEPFARAERSS